MKLLIFAHTPPPHHGQSYMVQLMLEGFGGDARKKNQAPTAVPGIECYHVNARFSRNLSGIGEFQGEKIFLIFWFCLQAIWIRFRYGVKNFYYVPAPGKRIALYRDWIIMLLCRPFFKNVILHWHAAGLAKWLETSVQIRTRATTYRLFRPVNLSIVLSRYNLADAQKLLSHNIRIVNNGIADPCPDFANTLARQREQRFADCKNGSQQTIRVLFLAHCTHEKGLFAALAGLSHANQLLAAQNSPLRMHLTVAGSFATDVEKTAFEALMKQPEFANHVKYLGFVSGSQKLQVLRAADMFCFPTHYLGENQPVNLIEAMAFGLPIVTTRWRSLPELFPENYPGLVDIQSPAQIASALIQLATGDHNWSSELRDIFQKKFTIRQHLVTLAAALHSLETEDTFSQ